MPKTRTPAPKSYRPSSTSRARKIKASAASGMPVLAHAPPALRACIQDRAYSYPLGPNHQAPRVFQDSAYSLGSSSSPRCQPAPTSPTELAVAPVFFVDRGTGRWQSGWRRCRRGLLRRWRQRASRSWCWMLGPWTTTHQWRRCLREGWFARRRRLENC